jgi:hypothetical protein
MPVRHFSMPNIPFTLKIVTQQGQS